MSNLPLHPMIVHLPLALSLGLWAGTAESAPDADRRAARTRRAQPVLDQARAADRVERVVAKALIHAHEDAAEAFVWSAGAIGLLFIAAAARPDGRSTKVLATLATVGSLLVFGLGLRAGHEGGELVYEHGAASVYTSGQPSHAGGATVAPNPTSGYDDD